MPRNCIPISHWESGSSILVALADGQSRVEEDDDFNRNLKTFEDHCKSLGIDQTLLVVPYIFDDNDVGILLPSDSSLPDLSHVFLST